MKRQSLWDRIGHSTHAVFRLLKKRDLLSLALVSKEIRSEVEPYIYSKVKFPCYARTAGGPIGAIIPLLRTILARPDLASHIKALHLGLLDIAMDIPEIITIPPDCLDLAKANAVIDSAGPAIKPFASQWKLDLEKGFLDAIVTLVISQLHNLRRLVMTKNSTKRTQILGHFLRAITIDQEGTHHALSTLGNLQRVYHTYWFPIKDRRLCGENTADVMPFFSLKKVKDLAVALDNPMTLPWSMANATDASHITVLDLATIRETFLGDILSHTRRVKIFTWQWFYDPSDVHTANQPIIDLDLLDAALAHIQESLEYLEITAECRTDYVTDKPRIAITGSLKGIAGFTRLHTIETGMIFLTGGWSPNTAAISIEHVVPHGIKCLHIEDTLYPHRLYTLNLPDEGMNLWHPRNVASALRAWSLHWRKSHPFLKHVNCGHRKSGDAEGWAQVDHLDVMQDMRITAEVGMTYILWERFAHGSVTRFEQGGDFCYHEVKNGICRDLTIDYPRFRRGGKIVSGPSTDNDALPLSNSSES